MWKPAPVAWFRRRTRREILALGVLGAMGGAGLYGYAIEATWVTVVERDLPIRRLPLAWQGRRMIQISDLHIGVSDSDYIRDQLEAVNRLRPDLLVITGDFMTCRRNENIGETLRLIETLKQPPKGIYAVLGNHDYGDNWQAVKVANELVAGLANLGIRTLRNESAVDEGLIIGGIDDLWSPMYAPHLVLEKLEPLTASIVLCHNPDACDDAVWGNYDGWIFSGHTHGGQCKSPFLPPPILPVKNRRYVRGEYDLPAGRRVYINSGLGWMWRVRFNVRPEITVFTMKAS